MKKNNGITLIALLVTILIILILVGIIISTIFDENGIIGKAQKAIKEQERAEVEELVIQSYVFKTNASMNIYASLDLEETAKTLYSTLTLNKYKLRNENGEEAKKYEDIYTNGDNEINLKIAGKHGKYSGTINNTGLVDGIKILEEDDLTNGNTTGDTVGETTGENSGVPKDDNDPLTITAIEDLVELSTSVNSGTTFDGETITLLASLNFEDSKSYRTTNPDTSIYIDKNGNEIDINGDGQIQPIMLELTTGLGFMPIGMADISFASEGKLFKGNFEGNGNILSNLYINRPEGIASLFGGISAKTTIQNLTLEDPIIYGMYSIGMAVSMDLTGQTTDVVKMDNCNVFGGIIGAVNENCVSQISAGILYAMSMGKINLANSSNSCTISGISSSGLGYLMGVSEININNCSNKGDIIIENSEIYLEAEKDASDNGVAGCVIAATPSGVHINDCENYGTLNGIKGGMAGIVRGSGVSITNCTNYGELVAANVTGYIDIAGIYNDPGYDMADDCTGCIEKVTNYGNITISGEKISSFDAAGIVGGSIEGSVVSAINKGNISVSGNHSSSSRSYAAGINVGEKNNISNCINYGNIDFNLTGSGSRYVGGISTSCEEVLNCGNYGNINAKYCAGIAYDSSSYVDTQIFNCYNVGNIIAQNRAAGIGVDATIKNSYNLGSITSENTGCTKELINIGGSKTNCFASDKKTHTVEEKQILLDSLNSNREDINTWSEWKIDLKLNDGYPVFMWQN